MNKFSFLSSNHPFSENASKLPVKSGGVKRRALGDITNAVPEDEIKEGMSKRLQLPDESQNSTEDRAAILESRPYMLRPCDEIDARDNDNPLLVTCYVNEIYDHFSCLEKEFMVNHNYMVKQEFINDKMRSILVDWLVEVHLKFKMVPESLYITVQIIDRYLELKQVRRSKLQLVGVAALLIAAKYEEIYPPQLKELVYITDKAYNKQEILEMEAEILTTLDFMFTVPTVHTFLCRYLKAAHADRAMVQLSCYLTERCLQEFSVLKYLPSQIAASAVLIARTSLKRHPWSPTLVKYTGYDEPDLALCIQDIKTALTNPNGNQQQAVYRKYSSSKFGAVAKMALSFN